MVVEPIDRILVAVVLSGKSLRSISKSAKLGVNFLSQMLVKRLLPKLDSIIAISDAVDVDLNWVITGQPRNKKLDSLIDLFAHLDFPAKKQAFKVVALGSGQTLEKLKELSEDTRVPLERIQSWIVFSERLDLENGDIGSLGKFTEKPDNAELDTKILRQAISEAYQIELSIRGKLGPPEKRIELIREIYELRIAEFDDVEGTD